MRLEKDVLLVVVGAGASYACVGGGSDVLALEGLPRVRAEDARPPLTQGLVGPGLLQDQILARYPAAKPLVAELRDVLGEKGSRVTLPFEQLLAEYQRSADDNPVRQRHLMALRFYLRDLLWACTAYSTLPEMGSGVTRYHRLVNELHHWAKTNDRHVCFVVFNYDLILEQACSDVFGFRVGDLSSHVGDPYVSIVKPHGSVNWAWNLPGEPSFATRSGADATVIRQAEAGIDVDPSSLEVVPVPPHLPWRRLAGRAVPALALPVAGKSELVWPEQHATFLRDGLRTCVRGVLTLGWRAMEPHFLELLPPLVRDESRAVLVTGGDAAMSDAMDIERRLWNALSPAHVLFEHDIQGLPTSLTQHLQWLEGGFR